MKKILFALSLIFTLAACSDDEIASPEIEITTPNGGFAVDKMQWLRIAPELKNADNATYTWSLDGKEIANTVNLLYTFSEAGSHNLVFKLKNEG